MANWAVITGDIINSSALAPSDLEAVFDSLRQASERIATWQNSPVPFDRFRGDGWQLAMQPPLVFRALIALRASVRAHHKHIDTRAAVGLGVGTLSDGGLSGASGPAFTSSGHALDTLKRNTRFAAPDAPLALRTALPLADQIIMGWTAKQAGIVLELIAPAPPTQSDLAQSLGVRRQLVQKQANAAGLAALLEACRLLESPHQSTK